MAKDNKYLKPIFASLGAIALILGGTGIFSNKDVAESDISGDVSESGTESAATETSPNTSNTSNAANTDNTDKAAVSEAEATSLTVSANKCRGCGKCVRIDPEHFAMDVENRVAIVIKTDDLDSEELQLAANNCEGGAIIIS